MTSNPIGKPALVWRGDPEHPSRAAPEDNDWHHDLWGAATENIHAEPAVYCEERADELCEQ